MKHDNPNAGAKLALDDHGSTASRHGVFYPTGYSVSVFEDSAQAGRVLNSIDQASDSNDSRLLEPGEMLELMDQSINGASLMAQIVSAELKQIEILRQFADQGCSFVIFDRDKLGEELMQSLVVEADPDHMIHYAMLAIENLTPGREATPQASPLGMNERGRDS